MKLQQLRYVVEIVRQGNHLSAAAEALNTSQPGVSRQIQLLEQELGFDIFVRTRNRIVDLTEPGRRVLEIAQRMLGDMSALRSLKEEISMPRGGTLTVGVTHTLARYVLPPAVEKFLNAHPDVHLILRRGDPEEICKMVEAGEADFSIGAQTMNQFPELVTLPCFELPRSIIAKTGHPILDAPELTLADVAAQRMIAYDTHYSGQWQVMNVFGHARLPVNVVLSAIDGDVCKSYVAMGLGVAIMTAVAYDPERDIGIGMRDASKLFPPSIINLTLKPNGNMRPYMFDFIALVAPQLTPKVVKTAMKSRLARAA
ncbi:HTH-type transcriptional regulator CysB [Pigmentiphaga soli]|uniref:HTH-type transcriptional regulator CysB n=1 Tax=Pigmentiphaga soli TaxID=1007095 RepID=A0ABP8GQI3_9BURK